MNVLNKVEEQREYYTVCKAEENFRKEDTILRARCCRWCGGMR